LEQVTFCHRCGGQLPYGAAYCNFCGTPQPLGTAHSPAAPEEIPPEPTTRRRRRHKNYFGASGVRGTRRIPARFGHNLPRRHTSPWAWAIAGFLGLPILIALLWSTGSAGGFVSGALLYWIGGTVLFFGILYLVIRAAVRPRR
jgi:hypothetical protein